VNPRRILHLLLVLLVAGGVALLFLVGPAGKRGRSSAPELTISQRLELDGHTVTNSDGDGESIAIAAVDIEPMSEAVAVSSDDEIITAAAVDIEPMGEPVPLVLHQDGLSVSTVSAAPTVGEVLAEEGVVVEPGDYLFPSSGSLVTAGTHIYIYRAREFFLSVGGDTTTFHSRKATVGEVLDEAGVSLGVLDRVEPALDTPVEEGLTIRVVQVREEFETVEEIIPLSVVYQDDPTMDMGRYLVLDWGADGVIQREYRVVYEDGQETERELLSEWEQPPSDQIVAQGTKPVNLVETPQGPLRYSYSLEMYATWYRPASCGKPADSPWYGLAATGVTVQRGIVAVDPNVIPLGTRLYIPGYGEALAADTGSAVIGNIIDLGFADYEVPDWHSGWVTVYILE
jgi:uncharacterized protein YabE (DUF348 family)/3D (Asp-Asp-Asp) domain-containing protein